MIEGPGSAPVPINTVVGPSEGIATMVVQAKLAEVITALKFKRSMRDYEEKTPKEFRRADAEKLKSLEEEEAMLQQHIKSMQEWAQQR